MRMTFWRALRSEGIKLRTSPLAPLHLICALAGGGACGAYFAVASWDAVFGADATVQLLGAMMPLMAGIVCGLAFDAEREAGGMASLLTAPSRTRALAAKLCALYAMGAAALALAVGVFAAVLVAAGRNALSPAAYLEAVGGLVLGSAPLYILGGWLALRFGRNVAIGVGAAGLLCAFFSIGGLAHGLMTGELTGAYPSIAGYLPLAWAARLGSLGVESAIAAIASTPAEAGAADAAQAAAQVALQSQVTSLSCIVLAAAAAIALLVWFARFEERGGES